MDVQTLTLFIAIVSLLVQIFIGTLSLIFQLIACVTGLIVPLFQKPEGLKHFIELIQFLRNSK